MLAALLLFMLGSGICGGATNMTTLIAGRALAGTGAGGVLCLNEIIICDLVPLRQRGQWIGVTFALIAVGTAAGPVFGGLLVSYVTWRWTFYISLPIGGVSAVTFCVFVRLNHDRKGSFLEQLRRIDWIGNIILIGSVVAVLIPLSQASTAYTWTSWHILVPLLIGLGFAMPLFLFYEGSRWCKEPTLPLRFLQNRTTVIALAITFFHAVCTLWTMYFLPVYFQGIKLASPVMSGVMILPTIVLMLPFVVVGGKLMQIFGRYKPVHTVGMAIMVIGFGLLSLLDRHSSPAAWIIFQIVEVAGVGMVVGILLPVVQASLKESDTALSASVWSFIRCFGIIWGVAIPSSIFNNSSQASAQKVISDLAIREMLQHGQAYEHATKIFLENLPSDQLQDQVITVFERSLRTTWLVGIAFAGVGFVLTIFEKEVPLRDSIDSKFGLKEKDSQIAEKSPNP